MLVVAVARPKTQFRVRAARVVVAMVEIMRPELLEQLTQAAVEAVEVAVSMVARADQVL
jgi:hypothetical protein